MANTWPKERRLLGTKVQRLDGPAKATGTAKYSYDINRQGMLHARLLHCPHAHAKLTKLDASAAEKMPGVAAVQILAKEGQEFYYAGTEILGLAADTEEHAQDAIRAVRVEYEVLDHIVKEDQAIKGGQPTIRGANLSPAGSDAQGNVETAFREADAVVEGEYGVAVIAHQCLESHGLVAEWGPDDNLTVWCSTQATAGIAAELARAFKIQATKVKCITHFMGGGFGSKFNAGVEGLVACQLAKKAGKPVKLMLDREEEILTGGTRPGAFGSLKIAGTKDGKITAFESRTYGSTGAVGGGGGVNVQMLPYVYAATVPNLKRDNKLIRLNVASTRAWRAPNHPQSCSLTEWAVDDLAAKLGLDPLQVRLKNLPPRLPQAAGNDRHAVKVYADEIAIATKLAEWDKKWHPPGKGPLTGALKHGIGMALHSWGGAGGPNQDVTITIASDGSVLLTCSTQDLGTGERTVLAIVTAETLGLEPKDVTVRVGESQYGRSGGSGGSTTCPSTAPAALNASCAARDELFAKIAARLGAKAEDLAIEPGKVVDKGNGKSWVWKEACAKLGMDSVKSQGNWTQGLSSFGVGGVQIAEALVDSETGVVRVTQVVAVQDCGLVVNKLCCESQVAGGVIMSLNPALFEERIMDRRTGRQVNPDMEFYKLGGIEDMPKIVVHMHDMPERGVIGIGEPPTISTTAAIGNAVFNALGVRVPHAPFTPDRVLAGLAKA